MQSSAAAVQVLDPTEHGQSDQVRQLPHNIEAEQALLGAILTNNKAYEDVSDFLQARHFAHAVHARLFEAVGTLIERGQIADSTTLRGFAEQDAEIQAAGGAVYLKTLVAGTVSVINAKDYGKQVYDLFLRRELIGLGGEIVNKAFEADIDVTGIDQIEAAEHQLYELAEAGEYEGGFQDFKTSIISAVTLAEAAHRRDGGLSGVTSGFRDLDRLLGGLHPSDLLILAGRPAMGKTALATNIAYNAAYAYQRSGGEEGAVAALFSLEMSHDQLTTRILSEQANIASDRIRKGELTDDEFSRLVMVSNTLHRVPIYIDDTAALTVSQMRTRARRMKRQHGLGLIIVDYLQLMNHPGSSRSDGRVQEVSAITRGLKVLAKDLGVPVVALSQLSRKVEEREDKRPQLSDLRESGSIEQDADVVMFVYRDAYYLEKAEPKQRADENTEKLATRMQSWEERMAEAANKAEILVAKQRHGPVGTVQLMFDGMYTRFGDLSRTDYAGETDRML